MTSGIPYQAHAREIRRALLVTAFFERKVSTGGMKSVRLGDQMRRFLELVNEMSYAGDPPSDHALFRSKMAISRALSIDEKDVRELIKSLLEFEVVTMEERGDGFLWFQLRAAKLAVAGRALTARAAIDEIEMAQRERMQQLRLQLDLPGCARSHDQARDYGLASALDEVAMEEDRARVAALSRGEIGSGRFPELAAEESGRFPEGIRGDSLRASGRFPEPYIARAGADSLKSVQTPIRNESGGPGAVLSDGRSGKRFADEHKNFLFEALVSLDKAGELADEVCRRTWVRRLRDEPSAVDEAVGEVRDEMRRGMPVNKPLARVFFWARKACRQLGRDLRLI